MEALPPHRVKVLSQENKQARVAACRFFLTFDEDLFQKQVIWSDEKGFVLTQPSNRKNDCSWMPANQHNLEKCKNQGGKNMLDILKNTLWPSIKSRATRRGYWMQQDGATPVMDFLRSKFGDTIVSRNSTHIWPPYSPDLSPLDFSFWSLAMSEVTSRGAQI